MRLGDPLGEKAVVLYFYPRAGTPGCAAEVCGFRDEYEDFVEVGAEAVGVSSDPVAAHERFARKHRLPFVPLSDEGGEVRRLYGVPWTFGLLPGRATYVIDKDGIVRSVFSSQLGATRHIEESLKTLRAL